MARARTTAASWPGSGGCRSLDNSAVAVLVLRVAGAAALKSVAYQPNP